MIKSLTLALLTATSNAITIPTIQTQEIKQEQTPADRQYTDDFTFYENWNRPAELNTTNITYINAIYSTPSYEIKIYKVVIMPTAGDLDDGEYEEITLIKTTTNLDLEYQEYKIDITNNYIYQDETYQIRPSMHATKVWRNIYYADGNNLELAINQSNLSNINDIMNDYYEITPSYTESTQTIQNESHTIAPITGTSAYQLYERTGTLVAYQNNIQVETPITLNNAICSQQIAKIQGTTKIMWYGGTTGTTEVIPVAELMLQILGMPFTFISQAFDVTLWAGTPYAINFANIFKGLIAILTILFIVRLFTRGLDAIGSVGDSFNNRKERKENREWRREQRQMQREDHAMKKESKKE